MLSEHEAFIEAILNDPTDNLRKLAYADWLEERGDYVEGIRARLIRLEIEAVPLDYHSEERRKIQKEMSRLKERYNWLLKPNMPPGFDPRTEETCLMIFRVNLTVTRFVEWGTDYLRGMPPYCLFDLTLSRRPAVGTMKNIFESVAWPRVVSLTDSSDYTWTLEEMESFVQDARLNRLKEIYFWGRGQNRMLPEMFDVLVRSPQFTRLESLTWYSTYLRRENLQVAENPRHCPRLKELRVTRGQLQDHDTDSITRARPNLNTYLM
jgi:uncharacterized protein (TIGR02996 family)